MAHEHTRDRIELQDVMLSYAAAVDERDRERYGACFTDDVEVIETREPQTSAWLRFKAWFMKIAPESQM